MGFSLPWQGGAEGGGADAPLWAVKSFPQPPRPSRGLWQKTGWKTGDIWRGTKKVKCCSYLGRGGLVFTPACWSAVAAGGCSWPRQPRGYVKAAPSARPAQGRERLKKPSNTVCAGLSDPSAGMNARTAWIQPLALLF